MPSISGPVLTTHEATIIALANSMSGLLLSAVGAHKLPQEQRHALRDSIEFGDSTLSHLTALLSDMQAKIQVFQVGYDRLQSAIKLATNTLESPIFSLPDDVLLEIMLLCVPRDGPTDIASYAPPWFPSVFALVSRKWKDLVYSSPRLWSSFQVLLSLTDPRYGGAQTDVERISRLINHRFLLTAQSTLTLHLSDFIDNEPRANALIRQICKHSERWEHLTLSRETPYAALNEVCFHRVQKLRSLELSLGLSMDNRCLTAFNDAPQLRCLTLRHTPINRLSPHFPWHQLTDFASSLCDPLLLNRLSTAQNLISLSVGPHPHHSPNPTSEPRSSSLVFSHLRRLFIATPSLPIIRCVVAPSLEHLEIQGGDLCGPAAALLRRSGCHLTALTVAVHAQEHAIAELLAACSSLRDLKIQAEYLSINALYLLLSDPTLVPQLTRLTVIYAGSAVTKSSFLSAQLSSATRTPSNSFSHITHHPVGGPSMSSLPYPFSHIFSHSASSPPSQFPFDDTPHVAALATALGVRLASLRSVSISNPVTRAIASTLLTFASQGIDVKFLIGYLPAEGSVSSYTQGVESIQEFRYVV